MIKYPHKQILSDDFYTKIDISSYSVYQLTPVSGFTGNGAPNEGHIRFVYWNVHDVVNRVVLKNLLPGARFDTYFGRFASSWCKI